MFTSDVLNNKCFRQMKHARLWKSVILWAISRREISPLVVIFKKKFDQTSWRTTRRNLKHVPQIVCISPRFRVLHLLSWNLSNPKILLSEDTLIYLYVFWNMLKSADLHWSILTPINCHKHVRYHDGVTLYFSMKFPSVAPKKTGNGYFSYMSADLRFLK